MCPIVIISLRNLLRSDLDGNDISLSQVDCLDTETQNKDDQTLRRIWNFDQPFEFTATANWNKIE